jgi:hypothetical protein
MTDTMKKLTEEQKNLIENLRIIETQNSVESERKFDHLIGQLELEEEEDPTLVSFIFDYVYNSGGRSESYLDYLREYVYGSEE